ncbi:MAG TPA: threonine-phosphate decarboxylase [Candidatus Latescibacteria bacterium]|nr:threonine-phosphate decarboxylase [Candidatus Latescibacterota bacterium]
MPIPGSSLFEHGGELEKLRRFGVSPDAIVDFSVNVNPLGPPEELLRVIRERLGEVVRYPEPYSETLASKLSAKLGVPEGSVVVSGGSNQMIYAVCRALRPERVLVLQPTFSEYRKAATIQMAYVQDFPLDPEGGFSVPSEELFGALRSSDLVFICNPNNPTGNLLEREFLLDAVRDLPDVVFVVDEAFSDFSDFPASVLGDAPRFGNLIVLRSFTKLFSVPGLRLGYSVSSEGLASALREQVEPWSVNRLAQVAGEVVIELDGFVEESRRFVRRERDYLFSSISEIRGLSPFPSQANFLLVWCPTMDASSLQARLLEEGIFIRNCSNFVGLDEHFFRVAVRKREENEKLISALKEVIP